MTEYLKKYQSTPSIKLLAVLVIFLAACGGPITGPVAPDPDPNEPDNGGVEPPPATTRTLTTWTIDPGFAASELDAEVQVWYERVRLEIAAESERTCPPPGTAPEAYPNNYGASATLSACSGVKHYIGRSVNGWVTSLLSLFRMTGDRALLEEVDRVMELARAQLEDTDGDGWRNFKSLASITGTDFNLKEDDLSHAFLPEIIYAFRKNAAYSTPEHDYTAHADAWLEYLQNDFEAKWAGRGETRGTEGLPVHRLMHPFIDMVRYTTYMTKVLPNDARYERLNQRLRETALNEFRTDTTPNGEAFVWSHDVRGFAGKSPSECLTFQMGTYPTETMHTFLDLALEGVPGFADPEKLQKLSRTVSESILAPNPIGFMYKDVGGPRNGNIDPTQRKETVIDGWCFKDIGYAPSEEPGNWFRSEGAYLSFNYGFYAAFAPDEAVPLAETKIYEVNREVYGDPASPETKVSSVGVPAAMAFAELYNTGAYPIGSD